jgi:hypothetical protein
MAAKQLEFDDADNPGRKVRVEADPQATVTPGTNPGTATVITPDGLRIPVVGDYRDVHARIQAAAARGHESGDAPRANTGVS